MSAIENRKSKIVNLQWLWPNRLPLGKLALLDGDPGLGKSLVALDLCARLSSGRSFPDPSGPLPLSPEHVIIVPGEDNEHDTLRPRLEKLQADLSRIHILSPIAPEPASPSLVAEPAPPVGRRSPGPAPSLSPPRAGRGSPDPAP